MAVESEATTPIPVGEPFDPAQRVVGLVRATGDAVFIKPTGGAPRRIEGYTVGAPIITEDPPHAGEMHPDGDELLVVVSWRFDVELELDDATRIIELDAGAAVVVPRGVWHRVVTREPGRLVHVTPGPGGSHRPLAKP